jgi:hypothetical protein
MLTTLVILGHFDVAVEVTLEVASRTNIVDEATARNQKARGTSDVRPRLLRGIESWMNERSTQARALPRSTDL